MMARKGISPLIAVVLLVVFTVGISVVISSWLSSYAKQTTEQAGQGTQQAIECAKAVVDITDATNNGVFVANVGATDITVTRLYLYDDNNNICSQDVNQNLQIGEEVYINYNFTGCPAGFNSAALTKVRAVTNCPGVTDEYTY